MRNWWSIARVLAILLLPGGLNLPSAAAVEPDQPPELRAGSPSPGYSTTLYEDGRGDSGSPASYPLFPQGAEVAAPEARDIEMRLQRLELQNAELVRQNEQLRESLGAGPGGLAMTQTARDGVALAGAVEPPADASGANPSEIAAGMLELKSGMERLGSAVEKIGENLTVTTADKELGFKLALFGALKGEFYHGQTVGSYLGGIVQNFDADRQGIRSTGAWAEIYYYWTPCLHSHFGSGIDDPLDRDLTAGLAERNQFYFGNILWDVTKSIDVGFEVSRWETAYMAPLNDNEAMVYDTRVRVKF